MATPGTSLLFAANKFELRIHKTTRLLQSPSQMIVPLASTVIPSISHRPRSNKSRTPRKAKCQSSGNLFRLSFFPIHFPFTFYSFPALMSFINAGRVPAGAQWFWAIRGSRVARLTALGGFSISYHLGRSAVSFMFSLVAWLMNFLFFLFSVRGSGQHCTYFTLSISGS